MSWMICHADHIPCVCLEVNSVKNASEDVRERHNITTVEFMFFMKPRQENKFINKSGMPIPKNWLKLLSKYSLSMNMSLELFD